MCKSVEVARLVRRLTLQLASTTLYFLPIFDLHMTTASWKPYRTEVFKFAGPECKIMHPVCKRPLMFCSRFPNFSHQEPLDWHKLACGPWFGSVLSQSLQFGNVWVKEVVQVFGRVEKMIIHFLKKDKYQKNIQGIFGEMPIRRYFSNLRQMILTLHHLVSGADTQAGSGCCDVQLKNV